MPGQLVVPNRRKRSESIESGSDSDDEETSLSDQSNSSKRSRIGKDNFQRVLKLAESFLALDS